MKRALVIIASTLSLYGLMAQNPFSTGEDSLAVENIRIEGLVIPEKPELKVPVPEVKFTRPDLRFNEMQVRVPVMLPPASIRIAPPLNQPLPDYASRYIKLGGGRFGTSLADVSWYNGRNKNLGWGADFHHRGMANGFAPFTEYLEHHGNAMLNYYKNRHIISGRIFMHQADFHHYGDVLLQTLPEREVFSRRNFFRIMAEAGLKRNDPGKKGDYGVNFKYRSISDNRKNQENHFTIDLRGGTELNEFFSLKGIGEVTLTGMQNAVVTLNKSFIHARPYLEYNQNGFTAIAGLGLNTYSDSMQQARVYPHAEAHYNVLRERLRVGTIFTGGMQYQTLFDWMAENRYTDTAVSVLPRTDKWNIQLYVSGKWNRLLSWKFSVYSRGSDNQHMYFSQVQRLGYFDILYDTGFVQNGFRGDLMLNQFEKWDAGVSFTFNQNNTSRTVYYFHQPAWMAEGFVTWIPVPELRLSLKNYTMGRRTLGLDPASAPYAYVDAPIFSDLAISMDYRFYKRFSLFLEANNLANQALQRWYLYPERPLDFRAGLTAIF